MADKNTFCTHWFFIKLKKLELFTKVYATLKNSFVYVSFVQGHFVHLQVHLNSLCLVVTQKTKHTHTHTWENGHDTVTPSNVTGFRVLKMQVIPSSQSLLCCICIGLPWDY